ncbi:hypothetical protein RN001_004555, partial [Aquatica leii]
FFRHGSRLPDEHEMYPNDPYKNIFKEKFGQLTNRGKQESYHFGKILRTRYNDFLGEHFHPNMVYVKSTDTDRTKMTALLVLAGLFPPHNNDKWSDELNWLPIPELNRPDMYCPLYLQELNRVLNSEEALNILKSYNNTLEILSSKTGKVYKTFRDVFLFHQLLSTEKHMNLALPNWAADEYKSIQYLTNMQCYFENYNALLKKLNGGRMLAKVINNIKDKILNTLHPPEKKIFLYSGHDNNIINILSSLNLYKFNFPNYNSAIFIELHQNISKEYIVKIVYFKNINLKAKELKLPKCSTMCNFLKFKRNMLPYLPFNYTKECDSQILLD